MGSSRSSSSSRQSFSLAQLLWWLQPEPQVMLTLLNHVLVVVVPGPKTFLRPSTEPQDLPPCSGEPLETLLWGGSASCHGTLCFQCGLPHPTGQLKSSLLPPVAVVSSSCPQCSVVRHVPGLFCSHVHPAAQEALQEASGSPRLLQVVLLGTEGCVCQSRQCPLSTSPAQPRLEDVRGNKGGESFSW